MERAAWPVGTLFGLSLAVVILLAGPLLLFNPLFTSALQVRHDVAAAFDTTQEAVERVTTAFLVDIYLEGAFDAPLDGDGPLLDADERSHMSDVSGLVRLLAAILGVAAVVVIVTGVRLRREPRRQGEIMIMAAGAIGTTALLLGIFFAVAFDTAFLLFHELLFPPGTFLFATGSDLITLFPEGFWFDAALAAGGAIILTALVVTAIGIVRWRSGERLSTTA
jgi:integral membrane protein (TIGR01906 family)